MGFYRPVRYPDDCIRIVIQMNQLGYDCTLREAQELWEDYSDSCCAEWLILPTSNEELRTSLLEAISGELPLP